MPNTPETSKGTPAPGGEGKPTEPDKEKNTRTGDVGQTEQAPQQQQKQEVPNQYKRRGVATPNSLMLLHRKGYILDNNHTLGSGAYAKVKVGTSLKMNIQVAIKIVNKLSAPKEVVERFLPREVETLGLVSNEHVVKLYEVIETPETLFFVMELADRGDLLEFINERKYLSERLSRGFFSDLVKGVAHCHKSGVVHRDLKCENLLLDAHMRLKISDFGFARKYQDNLKTFCGSFAYAAPEVILGNPYDGPLADIWSMGVILYAMVTGRLPFKDTSTSVLMADIAVGPKFSSRHSDKLKALVRSILTYLPRERATMKSIQNHPWMEPPNTQHTSGGDSIGETSKGETSTTTTSGPESPPTAIPRKPSVLKQSKQLDDDDVSSNIAPKQESKTTRRSIFNRGRALFKMNTPKLMKPKGDRPSSVQTKDKAKSHNVLLNNRATIRKSPQHDFTIKSQKK